MTIMWKIWNRLCIKLIFDILLYDFSDKRILCTVPPPAVFCPPPRNLSTMNLNSIECYVSMSHWRNVCVCVCVCSMITQFISAVITQPVRKRSAKWYRLIDHDEKRQEEERKNCKDVYHTYTFWVLSYTKFAPFKVEWVNFLYHTHTPYEVTCLFLHHATPDVLLHQYGISYPWRVYVHADSFNGTFCGCNCKPTWTLSGENKNTLFTFSP